MSTQGALYLKRRGGKGDREKNCALFEQREGRSVCATARRSYLKTDVPPIYLISRKADVSPTYLVSRKVDVSPTYLVSRKVDVSPTYLVSRKADVSPTYLISRKADVSPTYLISRKADVPVRLRSEKGRTRSARR